MKTLLNPIILIATLLSIPNAAIASTVVLDYYRITSNSDVDVASQLSTTVFDQNSASLAHGISINPDEVLFTFTNTAVIASNIAEVYFDDGVIFSQTRIFNSISGFTNFDDGGTNGINPGDLPSGNTVAPNFVATANFGADITPGSGSTDKGVNASIDILGIVIKLKPLVDFNDLRTALFDGTLRLGLHVRSIGATDELDGESDSFINNPIANPDPGSPSPVPVPAALWLFGSAMLMLTGYNRKKA